MSGILSMLEDSRLIERVWFDDDLAFVIGISGVTKIEIYGECGSNAFVPWVAVYQGEEIWQRFPASMCGIQYPLED